MRGGGGGAGIFSVSGGGGKSTRVHVCSKDDPLKVIVERLAVPGVRRLVVVHPETLRVEGIVSLSDCASYLFT